MLKSLFNSRHEKLASAISVGDGDRVARLLSKTSAEELQQPDGNGQHLLERSIREQQAKILRLLLQKAPTPLPSAACGAPLTVLALQQQGGSLNLLTALLQAGAEVNQTYAGRPLLHHCAEYCNESELMLHLSRLLEYGATIDLPDETGTTLFAQQLASGNLPLLQFLLQSGATCEIQWLDNLTNPALATQLRRTLEDLRIRRLMLGR